MSANKTPWIILLLFWMVGSTWWHVCKIKQLCLTDDSPLVTSANVSRMPSLAITDGNRFRLDLPGNLSFARSGADANMNTLRGSLDSLTAYLKTSGRTLEVTGYYMASEKNGTTFPNLGLARAEGLKQYLVQQGIPTASLRTKGELNDELTVTLAGDSLYGGVAFGFGDPAAPVASTSALAPVDTAPAPVTTSLPATEEGLAAAEKFTSVFKPIDLYFPLAEANYIKTPDTQKFFEEAATYLAAHKDKKLHLTGHTDNSGPDDVNLRLSRDRANEVKARLRKSGIDPKQVVVEAKGEASPKASNDTRQGRKANRRVTVVVR